MSPYNFNLVLNGYTDGDNWMNNLKGQKTIKAEAGYLTV